MVRECPLQNEYHNDVPKSDILIMYSDSQKHESSCLLSDHFWCISPEPFELQKIFLSLLASLFEELSGEKEFFKSEHKIT